MIEKGNVILFGDEHWYDLLPLTFTRPVSEMRIGILTVKEKWEKHLNCSCSDITQDYLSKKYPVQIGDENILINATFLPHIGLINEIYDLPEDSAMFSGDELVAAKVNRHFLEKLQNTSEGFSELRSFSLPEAVELQTKRMYRPHHIFKENGHEIKQDYSLVVGERQSAEISDTNRILGDNPVFLEDNVTMECCILNTTDGPIYIGEGAIIMENSVLKGPLAIGNHATVKVGAKIYGETTIGPNCKVGGEVQNVVFFANSNKGHDGYLGNSVIGEWCNLGADTNSSNLKNNYLPVKTWSYKEKSFTDTGLQFCGLVMGDHSKTGINTMLNTGTVVGIACNIFGDGFPRTFIPSFSWGGAAGFTTHQWQKAIETAVIVMRRRGIEMTEEDKEILHHVFSTEY
ncbi:MAG: putative sugar nucleotidyl transferase [Saprospiraceae bacterium]